MVDIATLRVKFTADTKGYKDGVKESKKETRSFSKGVKKTGVELAKFGASAVLVGVAMKKAFDFAEEGAGFIQTRESFEGLMDQVGAAPDILQQMKTESRGTISEMQLMASTTTLLAGAQGELAKNLAASTPELLKIAKAANKLNPTLGSTAHLFESLSIGIKRSSPLVLDNLGLTIKIGEANKVYAEKLGKTVAELTAAEKQQALLNDTLRAGRVLVQQAGGDTESLTDAYQEFKVLIEESTISFKEWLAQALLPTIKTLNLLATREQQITDATQEAADAAINASKDYAEYEAELDRLGKVTGRLVLTQHEQNTMFRVGAKGAKRIELSITKLTETERAMLIVTDATTESILRKEIAEIRLKEATDKLAEAERDLNAELKELNSFINSDLTQSTEAYRETVADLADEEADLLEQIEKIEENGVAPWEADDYDGLTERLGEVREAADDVTAAFDRQTSHMIFNMAQQRLAMDGLTEDEMDALTQLAGPQGLGLIDQAAVDTADAVNTAISGFSETGDVDALGEDLVGIKESLTEIPSEPAERVADEINAMAAETIIADEEMMGLTEDIVTGMGETEKPMSELIEKMGRVGNKASAADGQVKTLTDDLNSIPTDIEVTITINVEGDTSALSLAAQRRAEAKGDTRPKAAGGPVDPGYTYRINERGQELFVPSVPGRIMNSAETKAILNNQGGGGEKNFNFYGPTSFNEDDEDVGTIFNSRLKE